MVQPGLENGSQKGEVPEWGEGVAASSTGAARYRRGPY